MYRGLDVQFDLLDMNSWRKGYYNVIFLIFLSLRIISYTVCPRSSDPFYIVTNYTIWVTTSWTYCMIYAQ